MLQDGPSDGPALLLAHGAGAGMESDFMAHMAAALGRDGWRVVRFNFPYMESGRRAPDRAHVLEDTFRRLSDAVAPDGSAIVGGKSLGGRIAGQAVAGGMPARGVFFLGYPLHPPGRPEKMRDAPLLAMRSPMLFVQGTRDSFCPLPLLYKVLKRAAAPHDVVEIADGDHSLKVRRSSGRATSAAWDEAASAVSGWGRKLQP